MFFESLEMGIGLQIVQWFQTIRIAPLDTLAIILDFMNESLFYVIALGCIYWMYNKQLGSRMLFALIMVGLVTLVAKEAFARPRPYQILDSGIVPLLLEPTYGIPSGHVAIPLVVWGYFALWMKRRWITLAVIAFVAVQALSRMYLGVHFPQDVILGAILGGMVLAMFHRWIDEAESWWLNLPLSMKVALPAVVGAITAVIFLGSQDGLTLIGLMIGLGIGVVIEVRYIHFHHKSSLPLRIAQYAIGLFICVIVLEGLDIVFDTVEPPTYQIVEDNDEGFQALQAEVGLSVDDPQALCFVASEEGLDTAMVDVCEVEVTPLAAILRVIRYALVAFFAMTIVPYLSIKANLMTGDSNGNSG